MRDDILVATSMFGAPIEQKHGAPVRLYVVPMYGYKSLKWMDGIEVGRTVAARLLGEPRVRRRRLGRRLERTQR